MTEMIVRIELEVEVDEYNRAEAVEKADDLLHRVLGEDKTLCRWSVKDVTFNNGIPVDHDFSDSPDYPGNSKGGIWSDE